ncbi:Two-component system WalR/WalK regulatory protein YycI [Bacillus rhizoplanae]|uniref:Two-component system WalR/WalK regulatory protein YycI n=1 Tax=Bacillus rhizoplanae TaxID=2880966 RepID=A0ABM8YCS5_9BACI|nr:two-component system regulatory protein YycI [Bacillus rhizoplanae]CAG9613574.1 Two-component system WalR/WalK regulatory protein YycI [Bacillus rhizoplanae]
MDWNRIKTIFIVAFFILDLFLLFQFIQKQDSDQLDYMTETNIEEQLKADKITADNLPKEPTKDTYIMAKDKVFSDEDIRSLKNQTASLQDSNTISSKLKEPFGNLKATIGDNYSEFLRSYVIDGQKYSAAGKVEGSRVYFFQKYKDKPIYYNQHGMIVAELNEKKEIISYTQTMLYDFKEMGEQNKELDIISARNALETLYTKNELKQGSHVKGAKLGYATVVAPSSSNVQVLVPTWNLYTDKMDYFVNAVEGQIIQLGKDNKENEQWSEGK